MKRIYIAGKIGFLPEHVYKANFETGKREAASLGFSAVSPVDLPHDHERTWKAYMIEDLKALLQCDAVYMLDNWADSRGARIERWFALRYGKDVYYQSSYNQIVSMCDYLRNGGMFVNIEAKSIAVPSGFTSPDLLNIIEELRKLGFLLQSAIA